MTAGANPYAKTTEDGNTPLHRSAYFGHEGTSKVLVAAMSVDGEGVDARNVAGETPLMAAASRGRDEVVRLLVSSGAEISATNDAGRTAIDMASKRYKTTAALLEELAAVRLRSGGRAVVVTAASNNTDHHCQHMWQPCTPLHVPLITITYCALSTIRLRLVLAKRLRSSQRIWRRTLRSPRSSKVMRDWTTSS
jgi:hypothetical protein